MELKQRNSIYYIEYYDEHHRRQRISLQTKDKSVALEKLTQFNPQARSSVKLGALSRELLPAVQHHYSENSFSRLKGIMEGWKTFIGDIEVHRVTPLLIEKYIAYRLKEVSAVTINLELRTLSGVFSRAKKLRLVDANPFLDVEQLPVDKKLPTYLTFAEFTEVISKIKLEWFKELMIFAVHTGMRREEIISLTWKQVYLPDRYVVVEKTKNGKDRYLPLNKDAYEVLLRLSANRKSEYVFVNGSGKKIAKWYVSELFKKYTGKKFHSCRHTFASWLVQRGARIYDVKDLLGHGSVKVTEIYSHLDDNRLRQVVNTLEGS